MAGYESPQMAQFSDQPGQKQAVTAHSGFTAAFQAGQGSVPMELSVSSSSASSSISSFPSSSFSSASSPSAFMIPMTPQRQPERLHPAHSMAVFDGNPSGRTAMATDAKKALDISNLMSPPEPDHMDSFSVNSGTSHPSHGSAPSNDDGNNSGCLASEAKSVHKNVPLSPPISPKDKKTSVVSDGLPQTASQTARDPILYPTGSDTSPSALARPLFAAAANITGDTHNDSTVDVVDGHVAARPPTLFSRASPPRGEDYELALYLKSEVMKRYMMDRRGWLKKEREQLIADRKAAADRHRRLHHFAPAARPPPTVAQTTVSRPVKPQHSAVSSSQSQQILHTSEQRQRHTNQSNHQHSSTLQLPVDNINRVVKRTSRAAPHSRATLPTRIAPQVNGPARQAAGGNVRVARGSPEPRVRTAAPNREDKDFMSLPDHCPPLNTLPGRTNNLKVDWKGNALDLSRDPYLHLLHHDEVGLAASLRLDCATYLTSKRRIFVRRLECARISKEFRKTDAQQACKIDVNKASKLWTAYDKVGWLRLEHMQRFL